MTTTLRTWLTDSGAYVIAAFRIVIGFLFLCHGTTSLWAWPAEPYGGSTAEIGAWPGWWGAVIQVVCGAALIVGFGTRLAAFLGSGSMAYAYFWSHQADGALPIQNDGESAALFCWAMFLIVFLGSGAFSIDGVIRRLRGVGDVDEVRTKTDGPVLVDA
ncbi:DoxX family protein [Rhodococcus sp. Q]|uniref:DoxX family protein n=1 Tax=Rhodococcus sp. Q TaxID=2502252 RepID=UPI0020167E80|nr:DoxX family protein [Rhodococcus sp. Q]